MLLCIYVMNYLGICNIPVIFFAVVCPIVQKVSYNMLVFRLVMMNQARTS